MLQQQNLEVSRIYKVDGESKLKAFVDIALGDWVIKGLRIVEGKDGLFLGMPRHQGKDGRWYNTVTLNSKEVLQELTDLVINAYNQ
ncbi:MAG: septation protein SpoVG family protein [Candidatus Omnitrophica bacterium]|nr:septation protein SpoVG family protein [Candidatus Omnitrophota bacterium]